MELAVHPNGEKFKKILIRTGYRESDINSCLATATDEDLASMESFEAKLIHFLSTPDIPEYVEAHPIEADKADKVPDSSRVKAEHAPHVSKKEVLRKKKTRVVRKIVHAPEVRPFIKEYLLRGKGIQYDMEIVGICPEKNVTARVSLKQGMNPERATAAVCTATEMTGGLQNMVLYRVDSLGWSHEISQDPTYTHSTEDVLSLVDIHDGDTLEVRRLGVGAVGGKFRISTLAAVDRFNDYLQRRVSQMCQNYKGYRKIRGDGNCYYRSICFGLLEQIVLTRRREAFGSLYRVFKNVLYTDRLHTTEHRELLAALASASEGTDWTTVQELEASVLQENRHIDISMIRACKKLVSLHLLKNKNTAQNGITLNDAILPSHDDVKDMTEFCREYVLKMDVCAEGAHVDMGILPQLLGCDCHLVILSRDRFTDLTTLHTSVPPGKEKLGAVHILFRPGHYDLLYEGHENEVFEEVEEEEEEVVEIQHISRHGKRSSRTNGSAATNGETAQRDSFSGGLSNGNGSIVDTNEKLDLELSKKVSNLRAILPISEASAIKLLRNFKTIEAAMEHYFENEKEFADVSSANPTPQPSNPSSRVPSRSLSPATSTPVALTPQSTPSPMRKAESEPVTPARRASHSRSSVDDESLLEAAKAAHPILSNPEVQDAIMFARQFSYGVPDILRCVLQENCRRRTQLLERLSATAQEHLQTRQFRVPPLPSSPGSAKATTPRGQQTPPMPPPLPPPPQRALGQHLDKTLLNAHANFSLENRQDWVVKLIQACVEKLGLDQRLVQDAVLTYGCNCIRSVYRFARSNEVKKQLNFRYTRLRQNDDDLTCQLIAEMIARGVKPVDAMDIVVLDECFDEADVIDVIASRNENAKQAAMLAMKNMPPTQLPNGRFLVIVPFLQRSELLNCIAQLDGSGNVHQDFLLKSTRLLRDFVRKGSQISTRQIQI